MQEVLYDRWNEVLVECNARESLAAAAASTPDRAAYLTEVGNKAGLVEALNELVTKQANVGRLKRPFEGALAAVSDAEPLLVPEPEEEALTALLGRRQQILAESRLRLDHRLEQSFDTVRARIIAAGDALVAAATTDAVPQTAVDEFERNALAEAASLGELAARTFQKELDELTAEERGLVQGPEMRNLADSAFLESDFGPAMESSIGSDSTGPRSSFSDLVQDFAKERGRDWLSNAVERGNRPGSPLHNVVYKLGKMGGHKFKPWEAVRWAKRLQGTIALGTYLFEVKSQIGALHHEEGELQRRQHELRRQVRDAADTLISAAREELEPAVHDFYLEASRPVREIEDRLDRLSVERSTLQSQLKAIRDDSEGALAAIGGASHRTTPLAIVALSIAGIALVVAISCWRHLQATQAKLERTITTLDAERQAMQASIATIQDSAIEEVTSLLQDMLTQAEFERTVAASEAERQALQVSIATIQNSTVDEVTSLLQNMLVQIDTDIAGRVADALALADSTRDEVPTEQLRIE